MPARIIEVTSNQPGTGKTHVAAALARLLVHEGFHPAPLHLSTRRGDPVACPTGGSVTRAAALLAEACRLLPEPHFDPPAAEAARALGQFSEEFDAIVAESGPGAPPLPGALRLLVHTCPEGLCLDGPWGHARLPLFPRDLMPPEDPDLAALPLFRLGSPRTGVVSLPHYSNFTDFRLLRGSEWIITQAPGVFDFLFLPLTTNPESDFEWLDLVQLKAWLASQHAAGCRFLATGWQPDALPFPVETIPCGLLADFRYLSRLLGRRIPPPLPEEDTLDELASWIGGEPRLAEVRRIVLHGEPIDGGGLR